MSRYESINLRSPLATAPSSRRSNLDQNVIVLQMGNFLTPAEKAAAESTNSSAAA
jgi:uncharacterized protein YbcI